MRSSPEICKQKGKGMGTQLPKPPLGQCSVPTGQDLSCQFTANNTGVMPQAQRTISLSFTITWLWEWQNRMDPSLTNSLETWNPSWSSPSDRAMKGRSPPAQWAHSSFGEGSAPWAEDLTCLNPPQNLLWVSTMLKSKGSSGTLQKNKEQAGFFFFCWWSHSLWQNSSENLFPSLLKKL